MTKSADAFRTISEVAEWLGIQAHVLRFWESKFTQVRPVKRAGGRRYYRPGDMLLLGGIKQLLHEDGLTIKGVQKILREEGMSHVATLSQPLDELTQSQVDDTPETPFIEAPEEPAEETGVVLSFDSAPQKAPEPDQAEPKQAETEQSVTAAKTGETAPSAEDHPEVAAPVVTETDVAREPTAEAEISATDTVEEPEVVAEASPDAAPSEPAVLESAEEAPDGDEESTAAALPTFLRHPMADQSSPSDNTPPEPEQTAPADAEQPDATDVAEEPARPRPRVIDQPVLTPENEIAAAPAILTAAFRARHLNTTQAKQIAPLLDKLTILRDSMVAHRSGATNPGPNS